MVKTDWRTLLSAAAITGAGLLTADCHSAPPSGTDAPSTRSYKAIDGYRDVKLGMTFEAMLETVSPSILNPAGLRECFDSLPLTGCAVGPKESSSTWEMRDGIGYGLSLDFNKHDRLTDLTLKYERDGLITAPQCRDILARTIDWTANDYGPLDWRREGDHLDRATLGKQALFTTPSGNPYATLRPDKNGNWVSQFMGLKALKLGKRTVNGKRERVEPARNLSIFASYIVLPAHPDCEVEVTFHEPDAVERPDYLSRK